jgi:hypothetical protein
VSALIWNGKVLFEPGTADVVVFTPGAAVTGMLVDPDRSPPFEVWLDGLGNSEELWNTVLLEVIFNCGGDVRAGGTADAELTGKVVFNNVDVGLITELNNNVDGTLTNVVVGLPMIPEEFRT